MTDAATRPAYQKFAVDVRPSRIDGQGAFALEPIPQRLKIGEIRGESISVQEARIRATAGMAFGTCWVGTDPLNTSTPDFAPTST